MSGPAFNFVRSRKDGKGGFEQIGALWPNKKGNGFNFTPNKESKPKYKQVKFDGIDTDTYWYSVFPVKRREEEPAEAPGAWEEGDDDF